MDDFQSRDFAELVERLAARIAKSSGKNVVDSSHIELAENCIATIKGFGTRSDNLLMDRDVQNQKSERVEDLLKKIRSSEQMKLQELVAVWREFSNDDCDGPAELYAEVGDRLIKSGEPLIGYDVLKSGLEHWPKNLRLSQLKALALARSGAYRRAAEILNRLIEAGHGDVETLGILAGTSKALGLQEAVPAQRAEYLADAYRLYHQGYSDSIENKDSDGALYNGINAATMALLLNENAKAVELAKKVTEICLAKPAYHTDYWAMATLGECALVIGQFEESKKYYQEAVELAGNKYANIASTRRNAAILFDQLGWDADELHDWLPVPNVAVFSGHMTDRPGMPVRFPHSIVEKIGSRLKQILERKEIGFAYASAACGADLLFLKALQELKIDYQVVLPSKREQFVQSSVAIDEVFDWKPAFDQALETALDVSVVNQFSNRAEEMHFEYTNQVMTGMAMLKSRSLGSKTIPIAVWDEKPPRGLGGTGGAVEIWNQLGWKTQVVNPIKIDSQSNRPDEKAQTASSIEPDQSLEFDINIRAMLFADVVGYSQIREEETPLFVKEFMGRVMKCIHDSDVQVESSNSWGDAIYLVFSNVEDAGKIALLITDMVQETKWTDLGFASELNLRTGLHVGPVFCVTDPVTQSETHYGAHVNRAARIEPVAPAGEVYASEAFAALASVENVESFICDYVGITPMAKGYGDFATYHLRRR